MVTSCESWHCSVQCIYFTAWWLANLMDWLIQRGVRLRSAYPSMKFKPTEKKHKTIIYASYDVQQTKKGQASRISVVTIKNLKTRTMNERKRSIICVCSFPFFFSWFNWGTRSYLWPWADGRRVCNTLDTATEVFGSPALLATPPRVPGANGTSWERSGTGSERVATDNVAGGNSGFFTSLTHGSSRAAPERFLQATCCLLTTFPEVTRLTAEFKLTLKLSYLFWGGTKTRLEAGVGNASVCNQR